MTQLPDTFASPTILIDPRAWNPLKFTRLPSAKSVADFDEPPTFTNGETYTIRGAEDLFAVCCLPAAALDATQDYANAIARLHHLLLHHHRYKFARLLVIGNPASTRATRIISAIETRYLLPVAFAADREAAAVKIESWASYFVDAHCRLPAPFLRP